MESEYTSVLANYCKSLVNDPTAQAWLKKYNDTPIGLEGPVRIFN